MLEFFRKYQRYFFVVVAVFIISSFAFFSLNYVKDAPQKSKPIELGKSIDGSSMWSHEIDHLTAMIATDQLDQHLIEKGRRVNLLNDGVIRRDILSSGLGSLLARAYFDECAEELRAQVEKHRRYEPYQHPYAPFISVEAIWQQFAPEEWKKVKAFIADKQSEVTVETFEKLVDLYKAENIFPSHVLKRYLRFQEQNYRGLPQDPALNSRYLGLFHCLSLEDWFGASFIRLVAQFIHNSALLAQKRGYSISAQEARSELIQHAYQVLKQNGQLKEEVGQEELTKLYRYQLYQLGLSEKEAIESWRKVMLFRRLFSDYGEAVVSDMLPYETFYPFASETCAVDLYRLPKSLEFGDFTSFLKFNFYLDAVASIQEKTFHLPTTFYPIKQIEVRFPELIEQRAWVEMAEVSIDEIAATVSLKEMWEWQLQSENYAKLEREFPNLAFKKEETEEGYYAELEKLSPEERGKVDLFSRKAIARLHPEWIEQALDQKNLTQKAISFSPIGKGNSPIERTGKGAKWVALIQKAALKNLLEESEIACQARDALSCFTPDGETYYRFVVIERDLTKQILTFEEADKAGILDLLLDNHLEEKYPLLRESNPQPFQTEEGEWKKLDLVKWALGKEIYAKRLDAIKRQCQKRGIALPQELEKKYATWYPRVCLIDHVHKEIAAKRMHEQGKTSPELNEEGEMGLLKAKLPLKDQWNLSKKRETFKRCDRSPWFDDTLFTFEEKSYSPVLGGHKKFPYFFFLVEKTVPSGPFTREVKEGQDMLGVEAKEILMLEILEELREKGGINLSSLVED